MRSFNGSIRLAALLLMPALSLAHESAHSGTSAVTVPRAAQPAVAIVDQFSAALHDGDLERVRGLLADAVVILESGPRSTPEPSG
jgi:hypothetical protein